MSGGFVLTVVVAAPRLLVTRRYVDFKATCSALCR